MKSTTPGTGISVVQVALGAGILALLGLISVFAFNADGGAHAGSELAHVPLSATAPMMAHSDRKIVEHKPTPFAVKLRFDRAQPRSVDYDAGNMMLELNCVFEDQCAEQPVVGMSELGQTTRLQTDGGALYENSGGFCVIQPNIKEFKRASAVPVAPWKVLAAHACAGRSFTAL